MSIISQKFNEKINSLRNEFDVNKNITHNGIKGGLNETELSLIIKEIIPQRFKITKGIIENSSGRQSNETDILIYDDEILPPYIKNDIAFIPVEAVKYIFEVKSTLNSNEIKTTISKFENFKSIGGCSPTALFSFSSDIAGSELSRYKKNDTNFPTNPATTILCISNKSYYYKETKEYFIKDFLSTNEFIESLNTNTEINIKKPFEIISDIMSNDEVLNKMTRSQFALIIKADIQATDHKNTMEDKQLHINKIEYDKIKFKIHKWIGIESKDNNIDLSFLSGISNTLSKDNFGNYLLKNRNIEAKIFSIAFEDMWGNISSQDFSENGLSYNPDIFSFTIEMNLKNNKIIFETKK